MRLRYLRVANVRRALANVESATPSSGGANLAKLQAISKATEDSRTAKSSDKAPPRPPLDPSPKKASKAPDSPSLSSTITGPDTARQRVEEPGKKRGQEDEKAVQATADLGLQAQALEAKKLLGALDGLEGKDLSEAHLKALIRSLAGWVNILSSNFPAQAPKIVFPEPSPAVTSAVVTKANPAAASRNVDFFIEPPKSERDLAHERAARAKTFISSSSTPAGPLFTVNKSQSMTAGQRERDFFPDHPSRRDRIGSANDEAGIFVSVDGADDVLSDSAEEKVAVALPKSALAFEKRRELVQLMAPPYTEVDSKSGLIDSLRNMMMGQLELGRDRGDLGDIVAIDCESVGGGVYGSRDILARVSVVNYYGHVLYDTFVRPHSRVTDWRTRWSGVRPSDVMGAPSFPVVRETVSALLEGRRLVGHDVSNDLNPLRLSHPFDLRRDTSEIVPLNKKMGKFPPQRLALKRGVLKELGVVIQQHEHSSVTDARASMALYRLWEKEIEEVMRSSMLSHDSPLQSKVLLLAPDQAADQAQPSPHELPVIEELPTIEAVAAGQAATMTEEPPVAQEELAEGAGRALPSTQELVAAQEEFFLEAENPAQAGPTNEEKAETQEQAADRMEPTEQEHPVTKARGPDTVDPAVVRPAVPAPPAVPVRKRNTDAPPVVLFDHDQDINRGTKWHWASPVTQPRVSADGVRNRLSFRPPPLVAPLTDFVPEIRPRNATAQHETITDSGPSRVTLKEVAADQAESRAKEPPVAQEEAAMHADQAQPVDHELPAARKESAIEVESPSEEEAVAQEEPAHQKESVEDDHPATYAPARDTVDPIVESPAVTAPPVDPVQMANNDATPVSFFDNDLDINRGTKWDKASQVQQPRVSVNSTRDRWSFRAPPLSMPPTNSNPAIPPSPAAARYEGSANSGPSRLTFRPPPMSVRPTNSDPRLRPDLTPEQHETSTNIRSGRLTFRPPPISASPISRNPKRRRRIPLAQRMTPEIRGSNQSWFRPPVVLANDFHRHGPTNPGPELASRFPDTQFRSPIGRERFRGPPRKVFPPTDFASPSLRRTPRLSRSYRRTGSRSLDTDSPP